MAKHSANHKKRYQRLILNLLDNNLQIDLMVERTHILELKIRVERI